MSTSEPRPEPPSSSGPDTPPPAPRRPDRSPTSNVLWYLAIILFITVLAISMTNARGKVERLTVQEFIQKLEDGTFNKTNVFNARIGLETLTFQDQPATDVKKLLADPQTAATPPPTAPTPAPAASREGKPSSESPAPTGAETPSTPADATKAAEGSKAAEAKKPAVKTYTVLIRWLSEDTRGRLESALQKAGIEKWGSSEGPSDWIPYLYMIVMAGLLLAFFLIMVRRMGGPGAAMSFGRSRGKMYAQEDLGVTFNDVAGIDEAVEELREIVEFLRNPGKYQALGGRIPRGVLLVGPPGTGKTLLAKAVAGEAGVPFFGLSGSDFVELFVGVGASRVRDLFSQAMQKAPSIIFIDELDALGKRRGEGGPGSHDERDQTLNALLVEMDGFASDQSVIVMAASNRPETLDPALMRPGRFDRHVLVDRPDIKGREAILKVHAGRVKMDDSVDLKHLAKLTPGFVGADLASLVNEAALLAARKNKTRVTKAEFEEGIERVIAGLEKQTRIIPEEEKERVAYHEIGHALVACSLPHVDPVHKVSIIPRGLGALGYTLQRPEEDRMLITKTEIENRIAVLLGGIAAEDIVYHENSTGASNDLQRATDLARRMITEFGMSPKLGRVHYSEATRSPFLGGAMVTAGDHVHSSETIREIDVEIKRIIDAGYEKAAAVLNSRRPAMEHLTRELLKIEVMDAQQLREILDQYQTGPQLAPGTRVTEPASSATAVLCQEAPKEPAPPESHSG